jgi:hypothetical protein
MHKWIPCNKTPDSPLSLKLHSNLARREMISALWELIMGAADVEKFVPRRARQSQMSSKFHNKGTFNGQ